MKKLLALLIPLFLCRCSTMERSVGLGAAVGLGTGVVAGKAVHFNMKGVALSTTAGLLTGAVSGYLLHRLFSKDETQSQPIPNRDAILPALRDPQTQSIWVPDQITGSRYIQGHWIYEIQSPSTWQLSPTDGEQSPKREAGETKGTSNE